MDSVGIQTVNVLYDALYLACCNIAERDSLMPADELMQYYIDRVNSIHHSNKPDSK